MHARMYDYNLTAGGVQALPVVGDFFKLLSSDGAVEVVADTGAQLDLLPGQGIRGFPFNRLTIRDKSGAANAGVIQIGYAAMIDDRITGEVSIISGEVARTKAGVAFYGSTLAAAVAGQYAHVQLWNPVASGKNAVVTSVSIGAGGAQQDLQLRRNTAALGVADAGWPNALSKLTSGVSSGMELRAGTAAAIPGDRLMWMPTPADERHEVIFREPVIVEPGGGLLVTATALNTLVMASFEFWQEPR